MKTSCHSCQKNKFPEFSFSHSKQINKRGTLSHRLYGIGGFDAPLFAVISDSSP